MSLIPWSSFSVTVGSSPEMKTFSELDSVVAGMSWIMGAKC